MPSSMENVHGNEFKLNETFSVVILRTRDQYPRNYVYNNGYCRMHHCVAIDFGISLSQPTLSP